MKFAKLAVVLSALPFAFLTAPPSRGAENGMVVAPAAASWHFLTAESVDLKRLLPPPPAVGSPAAEADLETILQVQAARTPEQIAWAKTVVQENVYKNSALFGAWFTEGNLPRTAAFFKRVQSDGALASRDAKDTFQPAATVSDRSTRAGLCGSAREQFLSQRTRLAGLDVGHVAGRNFP